MKKYNSFFKHLIFISFSLFLLNSCEEPETIGLKQFETERLSVKKDTLILKAISVKEDSIVTNNTVRNLIGTMNDPVFGKTTAGIYTQFVLSSTNVNFGENPILDSVVLKLDFDGYYGDITKEATFNVYEVTEDIVTSRQYYSTSKTATGDLLASKTFLPKPDDSITIAGIKYHPHLRIKLSEAFGNKLLNASATDLANSTNFLQFMKGLYIVSDSNANTNSMLYFNLLSTLSQITIYYHNQNSTSQFSYNFIINTSVKRYNTYLHNYKIAEDNLKNQIFNNDTSIAKDFIYMQSMGGIKVYLNVYDELKKLLPDENYAVNKAELIIKPVIDDETIYPLPATIDIVRITPDNKTLLIPDYNLGSEYVGGSYNKSKNEYKMNLSLYLQDLVNKKYTDDKGLYLFIDIASSNAERMKFFGYDKNNPFYFKLIVTHTKLSL